MVLLLYFFYPYIDNKITIWFCFSSKEQLWNYDKRQLPNVLHGNVQRKEGKGGDEASWGKCKCCCGGGRGHCGCERMQGLLQYRTRSLISQEGERSDMMWRTRSLSSRKGEEGGGMMWRTRSLSSRVKEVASCREVLGYFSLFKRRSLSFHSSIIILHHFPFSFTIFLKVIKLIHIIQIWFIN